MECVNVGQNINAAAVAFAGAVSQGLTSAEIELLAGFFTVVGDSLATISAACEICENRVQKQ